MAKYFVLNKKEHLKAGWRKADSFDFAARHASVAVLLDELPQLIPTLPLAFIRPPSDDGSAHFELIALLSLVPGQNLFVAPNGRWLGGYIPSAFRGYPFRLLPEPSSGQRLLCFDQESGLITDSPAADGEAFFDAAGELSATMQKVMNFLSQCEHSRQRTQAAVDLLAQHQLIVPWSIRLNTGGQEASEVKGLYRIDEDALRNLSGDALQALTRTNALSLAYAQLLSQHRLQGLSKLQNLHARAKQAQTGLSTEDVEGLFGTQDDTLKFNF